MDRVLESRMMSFLLQIEEECVTGKYSNSKQAESPTCTENRTRLCISLQFHNLRLNNALLLV